MRIRHSKGFLLPILLLYLLPNPNANLLFSEALTPCAGSTTDEFKALTPYTGVWVNCIFDVQNSEIEHSIHIITFTLTKHVNN